MCSAFFLLSCMVLYTNISNILATQNMQKQKKNHNRGIHQQSLSSYVNVCVRVRVCMPRVIVYKHTHTHVRVKEHTQTREHPRPMEWIKFFPFRATEKSQKALHCAILRPQTAPPPHPWAPTYPQMSSLVPEYGSQLASIARQKFLCCKISQFLSLSKQRFLCVCVCGCVCACVRTYTCTCVVSLVVLWTSSCVVELLLLKNSTQFCRNWRHRIAQKWNPIA